MAQSARNVENTPMQNFRILPSIAASLLVALLPVASVASELTTERIWRSPDGKTLRGTWVRTINDSKQIEVLTSAGKSVIIAVSNLSEADRQLVTPGQTPKEETTAVLEKPAGLTAFREIPALDRDKLPVISQEDFGNKASDCVPSSFCNFLLWWDQVGVLEIPKRGDFDAKAEWVHSRMARYCVTRNNSGTYVDDATKGFKEYFEKDLADFATLKIRIDYDLRPENLARYTVGGNATMLQVTIRETPRHDSGHWVALVSASADGTVVFHTWGARFEGKIEVLEKKPGILRLGTHEVPATSYEIKIRNTGDLPEWFRNGDRKFILDPAQWDSIYVLKPFVYKEKGQACQSAAGFPSGRSTGPVKHKVRTRMNLGLVEASLSLFHRVLLLETHQLRIERFRIVSRMRPLDFAVQRLHVLEGAAEILRRTGARAFEHFRPAFAGGPFFENDLMDPLVGEIVAIEDADRQAAFAEEFLHGEHRLILELAGRLVFQPDRADDIDESLALAVAEFVRALVVPAHHRLHSVAELDESDLRGNGKPPPDLRLDPIEKHLHHHPIFILRLRHARSL